MGYDAAPLALGAAAIEAATADFHIDQVRANLRWLLNLSRGQFGGSAQWAMNGGTDRRSVELRQVAVYLAHTQLGITEADCAAVFNLSRMSGCRAVTRVEARRCGQDYNTRIERLERLVQAHRAAPIEQARPPNPGPDEDAGGLFPPAFEGVAA